MLTRLLISLLLSGLVLAGAQGAADDAQDVANQTPPADVALLSPAVDVDSPSSDVAVDTPTPALFAVGLSAGFPSYQTVALAVSLQSSFVGLQAKGSWTPAGPYLALQLRGYPPLAVPVPLYLGVGLGLYGPNLSYHGALGAHVPLDRALRLDVEAGVASVPLFDGRRLAPHLAVGLSYAVPVSLETNSGADREARAGGAPGREGVPACTEPREPERGALSDALEWVVDQWLASARATYGSIYTDLSYRYAVSSSAVSGSSARLKVSYSGSVREIATGTRHEASGSASAEFEWTGCSWVSRGVSY